jgi:hypothetical protein
VWSICYKPYDLDVVLDIEIEIIIMARIPGNRAAAENQILILRHIQKLGNSGNLLKDGENESSISLWKSTSFQTFRVRCFDTISFIAENTYPSAASLAREWRQSLWAALVIGEQMSADKA